MSKRVIPNLQFNINGDGEPDYSIIGENEIIQDILLHYDKWDNFSLSMIYIYIFGHICRSFSLKDTFISVDSKLFLHVLNYLNLIFKNKIGNQLYIYFGV